MARRFSPFVLLILSAGCLWKSERRIDYQRTNVPLNRLSATVTGRDPDGYPLEIADRLEIAGLLHDQRFDELDGALNRLQSSYSADFHEELSLFEAYAAFQTCDTAQAELLATWRQRLPQSAHALIAEGTHLVSVGWCARGHHFVDETTPEQFEGMDRAFIVAGKDLDEALKRVDSPVAWSGLLEIAKTSGNGSEFDSIYERANAHHPYALWLHRRRMSALRPRWHGSYAEMEAFAASLAPRFGTNPALRSLRGWPAWDQATVLERDAKDHARARALLDSALSFGADENFYEFRGWIGHLAGDDARAERDLDLALRIDPHETEALLHLASVLLRLGRDDEAIAFADLADRLMPSEPRYSTWRVRHARDFVRDGWQQVRDKRWAEAMTLLERALQLDPSNGQAFYWQGRVHLQRGEEDAALASFEQAITFAPHDIEAYRNVDYIKAKRGQWDDVVRLWGDYLALEPSSAAAYLERAGTYRHAGNLDNARSDLQRACSLGSAEACALMR